MTAFTDPAFLSDTVDALLTALSAALTAGSRPVDRVVRFSGVPSWDCEMLAAWTQTRLGGSGLIPNIDPIGLHVKHVVDVNLLLLRCVTTHDDDGNIPSESTVDADGDAFMRDQWILQRTIARGVTGGTLFARCQDVRLQPIQPAVPSGGFSGMTTKIEVTLG